MAEKSLIDLDFNRMIEHGVFITQEDGVEPKFDQNLTWSSDMLPGNANFKPFRLVIGLENSGESETISFQVYITHTDKRYGVQKLAKWTGTGWEVIPANLIEVDDIPYWAGYFDVQNYKIGDPPIAVG